MCKSIVTRILILLIALFSTIGSVVAQQTVADEPGSIVTIKSNLPYWGTATFNAGVEVRLARQWTFDLEAGLNPFDDKKEDGSYGRTLKHFRLHPELRYWFCESFYKHFVGLHVPFLIYNFADVKILDLENERRQGWGTGLGLSYGYQWPLSKHWSLEGTLGVGYLYLNYDRFPCTHCGNKTEDNKKHYLGPTQAAVNLIYAF